MPRPCHPRSCRSSQSHGTAGRRETACGLLARVQLLPATTRSSTKLLSDAYQFQMQVDSVKPNNVCHERGKEWQLHTTKKDFVTVGLAVRIFTATMRTFTKNTALSEQGRGAAWHGMCELTNGMVGERHGRGMLCVNRPLLCEMRGVGCENTTYNLKGSFLIFVFVRNVKETVFCS